MTTKKAPSIICQKCHVKVTIVFLTDNGTPVFTPAMHGDDLVSAIVATNEFPYPDASTLVSGSARWICEKCLGGQSAK